MTTVEDRRDEFKKNITDLKLDKGQSGGDAKTLFGGLILMVVGVVGAFVLYISSLTESDLRNIALYQILAYRVPGVDGHRSRDVHRRVRREGPAVVAGASAARRPGPDRSDRTGTEHPHLNPAQPSMPATETVAGIFVRSEYAHGDYCVVRESRRIGCSAGICTSTMAPRRDRRSTSRADPTVPDVPRAIATPSSTSSVARPEIAHLQPDRAPEPTVARGAVRGDLDQPLSGEEHCAAGVFPCDRQAEGVAVERSESARSRRGAISSGC